MNIFNLFLFLLVFWALFLIGSQNFSPFFILSGIFFSFLVSGASFKLGLVEKKSELLYLSFGFYRYFFGVFFENFLSSIRLIIDLAINPTEVHPVVLRTTFTNSKNVNLSLLEMTINMTCGLSCVEISDDTLVIHAINRNFIKDFDPRKICKNISAIGDDSLV